MREAQKMAAKLTGIPWVDPEEKERKKKAKEDAMKKARIDAQNYAK